MGGGPGQDTSGQDLAGQTEGGKGQDRFPPAWEACHRREVDERPSGYVPCAIAGASLAELNGASELLATPLLHQHKLPALVQHLLHRVWHVYYARRRYQVVVFLNVAVIQLLEPEAVWGLAILVHAWDVYAMADRAFPAKRRQRADVGMHGREKQPRVRRLASDVLWPVIPIDAHRVHLVCGIILRMQKLHDAAQVIGLPRWLAHEVDVICVAG